jgi:hypothetical protein
VTVRVVQVNLDDRKIDFELNEMKTGGGKKQSKRGRKPDGKPEEKKAEQGKKKSRRGRKTAVRRKSRSRK